VLSISIEETAFDLPSLASGPYGTTLFASFIYMSMAIFNRRPIKETQITEIADQNTFCSRLCTLLTRVLKIYDAIMEYLLN